MSPVLHWKLTIGSFQSVFGTLNVSRHDWECPWLVCLITVVCLWSETKKIHKFCLKCNFYNSGPVNYESAVNSVGSVGGELLLRHREWHFIIFWFAGYFSRCFVIQNKLIDLSARSWRRATRNSKTTELKCWQPSSHKSKLLDICLLNKI